MDSSVSETYGRQQGTACNGYFECLCYHPLFFFNQFGDLASVLLWRGNKVSAKFWRRVLLPVLARYRHLSLPKFFRGEAAFADPALYCLLEKKGYRYGIRLKANAVLAEVAVTRNLFAAILDRIPRLAIPPLRGT